MALFETLKKVITKKTVQDSAVPFGAPGSKSRINTFKKEAVEAENFARKENSLFGVMSNTVKGLVTKEGRRETRKNLWEVGYKEPAKEVATIAKEIGQGTARSVASFGAGVAKQPIPIIEGRTPLRERIEILKTAEVNPKSKLAQAITGRKGKFSLASEGETLMRDLGFEEEKVKRYGPTVGLVIGSLDLTGFGGAERKVAQEGLENIAKTKNTVKIIEQLVDKFKMSADEASEIAPKLINTDNKQSVQKVIEEFVNSKISTAGKERGFIESVKESKSVSDEVKEGLSNVYTQKADEELIGKAKELVSSNVTKAESMVLSSPEMSDDVIATGIELAKHYDNLARGATDAASKAEYVKKSRDIYSRLAEKGTESARSLRAFRLINDGKATSVVRNIAQQVDSAVRKGTKGAKKIEDEEYLNFMERAEAIDASDDLLYKIKETRKLSNELKQYVPTDTFRRITTVWKAGLLTGVQTTGLNTMSNMFHFASEIAKDIPAVMVDIPMSIATGKRSKVLTMKGLGKGFIEGAKKGWNMMKTGVDETDSLKNMEMIEVNFPKNKAGDALKAYTDTVFNIIGGQDKPFFYGARARSLYEQALVTAKNQKIKFKTSAEKSEWLKNFVANPPEQALENATADALTTVFRKDTYLGGIMGKAKSGKYGAAAELIVPFSKTPAAVALQMYKYTPVGPVTEILGQIISGKFNQKELAEAIGRGTIGTAASMWLGRKLQEKGRLSLSFERSDEKGRELNKLEGVPFNSVKIGDKWLPVSYFGPAGYLLVMGGYYNKALEETGSVSQAAIQSMFQGIRSLKDQTFLTNINQVLELMDDPKMFYSNFLPNFTGSFVPSIVKNVGQAFDPNKRLAEGLQGPQSRLPGLRNRLPPQVDVFGNPIQRPQSAVGSVLSPLRTSQAIETPVSQEMRRLVEGGYESAGVPKLDRVQNGIRLNTREYAFMQILVGKQIEQVYTQTIQDPAYQNMTDEQKADVLAKRRKYASKAVRDQIFPIIMARRYGVPDQQAPAAAELIKTLAENDRFKNATKRKQDEVIVNLLTSSGLIPTEPTVE